MRQNLLDILACPDCKSKLTYIKKKQELICYACSLAFPIQNEIPVMLSTEARSLTNEERLHES